MVELTLSRTGYLLLCVIILIIIIAIIVIIITIILIITIITVELTFNRTGYFLLCAQCRTKSVSGTGFSDNCTIASSSSAAMMMNDNDGDGSKNIDIIDYNSSLHDRVVLIRWNNNDNNDEKVLYYFDLDILMILMERCRIILI